MILDEKRDIIMPLLDELRKYNHSIGSYDKSMMTESFDYSVKLSNGLIKLPEELVHDYENNPGAIMPNRFESAASNFAPSKPITPGPPPIPSTSLQKPIEKKNDNVLLKTLIAAAIIIIIIFLVSRAQQHSEENAAETLKTGIRNNVRSYVIATSSTYNYRPIGGITNLKITVANKTDYSLDIVKVRVAYIKQNGGVYKYEEMNFNSISPHSQMTINAPDSDRGTHVQYGIETISSSQLGL